MRTTTIATLALTASLVGGAAYAQTNDAPASPSGAPAAAAQDGSSMAGEAGAKNEMKAHKENEKAQNTMGDPHKQSR